MARHHNEDKYLEDHSELSMDQLRAMTEPTNTDTPSASTANTPVGGATSNNQSTTHEVTDLSSSCVSQTGSSAPTDISVDCQPTEGSTDSVVFSGKRKEPDTIIDSSASQVNLKRDSSGSVGGSNAGGATGSADANVGGATGTADANVGGATSTEAPENASPDSPAAKRLRTSSTGEGSCPNGAPKWERDPNCRLCRLKLRDPKPEELVMYLHAIKYQVRLG